MAPSSGETLEHEKLLADAKSELRTAENDMAALKREIQAVMQAKGEEVQALRDEMSQLDELKQRTAGIAEAEIASLKQQMS